MKLNHNKYCATLLLNFLYHRVSQSGGLQLCKGEDLSVKSGSLMGWDAALQKCPDIRSF